MNISPHPMDRIIERNKVLNDKRADVLQRLNDELRQSPFGHLFQVVDYESMWNTPMQHWDVTFRCQNQRKFVVNKTNFFHIYLQSDTKLYRVNNRIKAYLGVIATIMKRYADEVDAFYQTLHH